MASDKTEEATPKKRRDSRRKGQVARSADLTGWAGLLVGLYLLPAAVGRLAAVVAGELLGLDDLAARPDGSAAVTALGRTLRAGFLAVVPLVAAVMVTGVLVSIGQTGLMLSWKAIAPDFKRVSPKQGFKRLFSVRSAWETGKQLLKITVVIAVAWPRVRDLVVLLAGRGRLGLHDGLPAAGGAVLGLARTIAWTVFVLSLADYGYQRSQHRRDLRMSKQEVRDEFRNAEGDGMVKARIRAMQRGLARNRMIRDIASADVVLTNPTHLAVALRYDPSLAGAPTVVAVGAGATAARIRARAAEASVPVVEAKPLARALWRACDVGDPIPIALYEAVAKVLAFVRRLDRRMASGRRLELPPSAQVPESVLLAVGRRRR